jgi:hypothetical protein
MSQNDMSMSYDCYLSSDMCNENDPGWVLRHSETRRLYIKKNFLGYASIRYPHSLDPPTDPKPLNKKALHPQLRKTIVCNASPQVV